MSVKVEPRGTLGILGGGQLARMMTKEATRMGYRVVIFDPDPNCPAAIVADECVVAKLTDREKVLAGAKQCDVVTIDTEHIPASILADIEKVASVLPSSNVMATIQDRAAQRAFLAKHDFPSPDSMPVSTPEELKAAVARIGAPSILKTRTGGYDGKGQARLKTVEDAESAWESLGKRPCILEAFVDFSMEISALVARRPDGRMVFYENAENVHRDGILHTTIAPARIPKELGERAQKLATEIAEALGHVGMMAVEMFVTNDNRLLVNEIAPRVHNSGHFTLGACACNQFEQHVRAVFGLPLGDTTQPRPSVMLNLLGDLWQKGAPAWRALESPHANLHLYGKRDARPGRKMGHVTVVHQDIDECLRIAHDIDAKL